MRLSWIAGSVAILFACSNPRGGGDATGGSTETATGIPPAVLALMDSAAGDYHGRDYERARQHWEGAVAIDSTLAAPWFGLFLARRALGRIESADSALKNARQLAQRE
jgi:hypothetical protein